MKYLLTSAYLFLFLASTSAQSLSIRQLRCEYLHNPLGIDAQQPRLSWQLQGEGRNRIQSAYQIQVAEDTLKWQSGKELVWDSGKRQTEQSIWVPYQGLPLRSRQRCYWRVKVWDEQGRASRWSAPAFWEMGLLDTTDWKANWIEADWQEERSESQPAVMLRHDFPLNKPIRTARAYVTAHGLYETEINGQKIDNQLFMPGWTSYQHRLQYQVFDVTKLLRQGNNAIGVWLADGWFRGNIGFRGQRNFYGEHLALLFQLEVSFADGSTIAINSDGQWKAATGPILWSDIYNGEHYDARLEQPGWSEPGFEDKGWKGVRLAKHSLSRLIAAEGAPVRRVMELPTRRIITTPKGEQVIDFGQNLVGRIRLKVSGAAGTVVKLQHAEVLDQAGNFYTENLRYAKQEVQYILKGKEIETYEPLFTFQGFRYVKVEGWPGELQADDFTAIVIHSDMEVTGHFECSEPLLNQLQHNIQWGQRGNFLDIPTDCPQRDERLGWTGDAQAFSQTAAFNMQVAGFFAKWLKDLSADQYTNGAVPWVIPHVLAKRGAAAAGWADAVTIIPWNLYMVYGDTQLLENQYVSMKKWVGYMEAEAGADHLWDEGFHFGDWLFYSPADDRDGKAAITDKYLIAQAFFAHSAELTRRVAVVLGKQQDAKYYAELLEAIVQAFRNEYVTPNGRLVSGTQTAYVLALLFDLLPESQRPLAAARLVENITRYRDHLTTGFLGTPHLCDVLVQYGYPEVAYALLQQESYPSWLYPVTKGATTIWERWDGIRPDGSLQNPKMNSFNHYAYGAIGNWMYQNIAGINFDPKQPGYKQVIIQPRPGGSLTHARASFTGPYGRISSAWQITNGLFELKVQIPANSRAVVYLPYAKSRLVKESGRLLAEESDSAKVQQEGEWVRVELGSGQYIFNYPAEEIEQSRKTYNLQFRLADLLADRDVRGLLYKKIPALRKHPELEKMKSDYLPALLSAYELQWKGSMSELENALRKIRVKE